MKIRTKCIFLTICAFLILLAAATGAAAQLAINDVDLSSPGKSNEVKPNELVTLSFEVKNEGTDKIEDIEALVYFERNGDKLEDDSGDEMEFEFDLDYLKEDKSKDVEFSFNVPFDVEDGYEYAVVIEVEGKNSSNNYKFKDNDTSETFEIVRERRELLFYKLDISPKTISCDRNLNVGYDIRNIGTKDEKINLSVTNNIFGITLNESFELSSDYDEDNKWEKTHVFTIPSTAPVGTYGLTINLYYNNGLTNQFNTTQITIAECSGSATGTTGQTGTQTGGQPTTTDQTQPAQGATQPSVNVQYTPGVATSQTVPAQKKGSGIDTAIILLVVGVVLVVLLVAILVAVMMRK